MNCHNCGLPQGALEGSKGREIQIELKAENAYRRNRKVSVWVCTDECGVQGLAVSKWGKAASHWPVTLAQFRATKPLEKGSFVAQAEKRVRYNKHVD